jgi:estrogen-related receptor ERR
MLEVLAACEPDMLLAGPDLACTESDVREVRTVGLLSDLYDRELVGIITWAKQIPGKNTNFQHLPFKM